MPICNIGISGVKNQNGYAYAFGFNINFTDSNEIFNTSYISNVLPSHGQLLDHYGCQGNRTT